MKARDDGGYALVAVLIAIAIVLSMATMELSRLRLSTQVVKYDTAGAEASLQAISALNIAWAQVKAGQAPDPDLDGCARSFSVDEATPSLGLPGVNTTTRTWVAERPFLCDPEIPPVAFGMPVSSNLTRRYYHFRYVWVVGTTHTRLSPPMTVDIVTPRSKQLFVQMPNSDPTTFEMPSQATSYELYFASTSTPVPPSVSTFRRVPPSGTCQAFEGFICLRNDPSGAIPPSDLDTNTTDRSVAVVGDACFDRHGARSWKSYRGVVIEGDPALQLWFESGLQEPTGGGVGGC